MLPSKEAITEEADYSYMLADSYSFSDYFDLEKTRAMEYSWLTDSIVVRKWCILILIMRKNLRYC